MAIKGPWVGSSAKAETGQSWMIAAGAAVRVGTPFMMSSLIGKSKSIQVYITSSDHNYNVDKLLNAVRAVMAQSQWSTVELELFVNSGVQLASSTTGAPCLDFGYLSAFPKITLTNRGTIVGRGGNGGDYAGGKRDGKPGGPGIRRNATLYINNLGVIGGGGGGGGGESKDGGVGGSGGAPLGQGGVGGERGSDGGSASFSNPNGPGRLGGYYGQAGTNGLGSGGAAGAAVDGGGTFGWINRGTVYGSAP